GLPFHHHYNHADHNCTAYHLCQDPYHWEQRILSRSKTDREGNTVRTWYNFEKPGSGIAFEAHPNQDGIYRPTDADITVTPLQARIWKVEYSDASHEEWTYYESGQKKGLVASYRNRGGNLFAYDYDANNYLCSVTLPDSQFNTIAITHDAYGLVTGVTDYANRTMSFEYDQMDKLTKTNFPDGTVQELTYWDECEDVPQDPAAKTAFILAKQALDDPIGRTGQVKTETNRYCPLANGIYPTESPVYSCFNYNELGQGTQVTTESPLGTVHKTVTNTYNNSTLQLVRTVDDWSTTVVAYNSVGQREKTFRLAEATVADPNPAIIGVWQVSKNTYDKGRVKTSEDYYIRNGVEDVIRSKTVNDFDASGRLSEVKILAVGQDTSESLISLECFEYDSEGRTTKDKTLLSGAPESGVWSEVETWYDQQGRATHVFNADDTYRRFWYNAQGNVVQTRNEEGHDFYMEYDNLGRLSRKYGTVSGGNAGFNVSFIFTVDSPNRTTKNKTRNNISGAWQEAYLGCCGRIYKVIESIKQGSYSQETRTCYLGDGKVVKVTYPDGRISETAFDELDRPVVEKRNGDSLLSIAYDESPASYDTRLSGLHCGSVVQTTDAMGSTTRNIRDGLGRTLREIDARNYPTVSYPAEYTATHTDHLGGHIPVWVSRVIDARSVPTKIAHDMLGREVSRGVDPLGL
ncbi:hypothetical protein KJ996_06580, partial [Patescibacteria group bacterium]|nr:hypothetical protein [Patescibacteria group bacterium]